MTDFLNARYRLVEVLGQGAMGVVWRAHDSVLQRDIAIKELRAVPGVDPAEALERFLGEARAAARLSHPNIVAIYDVFREPDRVVIAMELVRGPTVGRVVATSGAQAPPMVRAIMAQVAQALAAAHGGGVVHRGLKPDNIFWTPEGRAVVADFGLARIGAGRGTVEGTVMGTPGYMAPEQVRGVVAGPATDVFGWGAVAYELASGRPPFGDPASTDPAALAYRVVHEDPPTLSLPSDPALAALISRTLAKDPSRRPTDGGQLVAAMGERSYEPERVRNARVKPSTSAVPRRQAESRAAGPAPRGHATFHATALLLCGISLALALLTLGGLSFYARGGYFVGLDGDQVAIFKGRPGGVLWFDPSVVEKNSMTLSEVPPAFQAGVEEGKEVSNKAAADRYVNNLHQEADRARRALLPAGTSP